jgi:hypothetical protein
MRKFLTTTLLFLAVSLTCSAQFTPPTAEGSVEIGRFPVFILTPPGAEFVDFELKASITNFGGEPQLIYYYHSSGVIEQEIGDAPDVWFSESGATQPRAWIKQNSTDSISAMLTDANSRVGGIVVVVKDSALIDSLGNKTLTWSVLWTSSADFQKDGAGRLMWRPIIPTRYISETFNP